MGTSTGSGTVSNGLIFNYDIENIQKSFKGMQTTNLLSNPENLAPGANISRLSPPSYCGYSFQDFQSGGPTNKSFVRVTRTQTVVTADWAWDISYPTIGIGTTFTFSCYARSTNGSAPNIMFSNPDAQPVAFTLTDQWKRYSTQFTSGIQGNLQFFRINRSNASLPINCTFDIANAQVELGTFASPYIIGSRTSTQVLIDLTGNNIIDVTNMTYDVNGKPTFNGSSTGILIPENNIFNIQEFSIEVWFNPTITSQNGFLFEKGNVNTQFSLFLDISNTTYFRTIGPSNQDTTVTTSTYIKPNVYNHICCTFGNGTKSIYINSVLVAQTKSITGKISINTNGSSIGVYGGYNGVRGYYFNGSIPVEKFYNRALTDQEVKQNYYALKSRFGI